MTGDLRVPDLAPDMSTLSAALMYAECGWYVVPVEHGSKNPGSVLGNDWQHQSSRDPEQIAAWFAGRNYGVALHAGRSGAVIFDVDHPELLPPVLLGAFRDTPAPMQSSRVDQPDRRHHVYRQPPGRALGNGTGRVGGTWGQVRGLNGVIIAAPSEHEDAAIGGRYRWERTGGVPVLPDSIAVLLDDASPAQDAASDATVQAFLAEHVGTERTELLDVWCRLFARRINGGESRHDRMVSVLTGALKEAAAGYFPAAAATHRLRKVFLDAVTAPPRPGSQQGAARTAGRASAEWAGILAWAVSQAASADPADTRRRVAEHMPTDVLRPFDSEPPPAAAAAAGTLDVVRADAVTVSRVRFVWEGRIPEGALTLIPGEEGIGKTTVGIRIMADLTRGTLPGEHHGQPRDVIVIAPEDNIGSVFVPRLREAGADLRRVHLVRGAVAHDGHPAAVIVPRDLPQIGDLARAQNAALVWIDSLVTTLPDQLKSISYKDTATVLRRLSSWAEDERVAVAAPWHLNKASGSDTAVRIMDSRAFRTAARSMLLVVSDPEAQEGEQVGIVALDKANGSTLTVPALRYRIRSAPYVVEEADEQTGEVHQRTASCGVAEWTGAVAGDGRQIARDALAPKVEREDSPQAFLRQYLRDAGEAARTAVLAAGKDAGHSESAVKRAAATLRVRTREESGQDEHRRPYRRAFWSLPPTGAQSVQPFPQSVHTDTTDPTDLTGEGSSDLTDPATAGQRQSGQKGQSSGCEPTGGVSEPTGATPYTPTSADIGPCARCAEPTLRYGENGHTTCPTCRGIADPDDATLRLLADTLNTRVIAVDCGGCGWPIDSLGHEARCAPVLAASNGTRR